MESSDENVSWIKIFIKIIIINIKSDSIHYRSCSTDSSVLALMTCIILHTAKNKHMQSNKLISLLLYYSILHFQRDLRYMHLDGF